MITTSRLLGDRASGLDGLVAIPPSHVAASSQDRLYICFVLTQLEDFIQKHERSQTPR
jgi:hypothetical protein